ncbi:uncharacterized protein LOC142348432 isoform X2 [Convolutriloba macropyga]|uniref:uncharacterized protein LOC142348432 isoform X2 n=1 Tax=Convolutriloba macropyga TaxID=536237 RepID=UPI003F51FC3E
MAEKEKSKPVKPGRLMLPGLPPLSDLPGAQHTDGRGSLISSREPDTPLFTAEHLTNYLVDRNNMDRQSSDLESSLFNASSLSRYIKQGRRLDQKIKHLRRENQGDCDKAGALSELVTFCERVCHEFQLCYDLIKPFIDRTNELFVVMAGILESFCHLKVSVDMREKMTFIKEQIVGSTPSTGMLEDEGTEDSVTSLLSATLDANIAANVKCQQISGDLSKLVDQEKEEREAAAAHTAAEIIALNKESKEFFRITERDASNLERMIEECYDRVKAIEDKIEEHKWKEYKEVQVQIKETKEKIRSLESAIDKSDEEIKKVHAIKEEVAKEMSNLTKESTEADFEASQKSFKELRKAEWQMLEQQRQLNDKKKDAEAALAQLNDINPSSEWPMQRIPRSDNLLACLLRGPQEVIIPVKTTYNLKKVFDAHSVLGPASSNGEVISYLVELKNVGYKEPKWPLLVCMPQRKRVDDETRVRFKTRPDLTSGEWSSAVPVRANVQYKQAKYNINDVYFTEAKIWSFTWMAVTYEPKNDTSQDPKEKSPAPKESFDILDDQFSYDLVTKLNTDWKKIFIYLKLDYDFIVMKEMDFPNSRLDAMLCCFNHWKQLNARTTQRVSILKDVFRRCKREDLLAFIEEQEKGTNPDV